MTKVGPDSSQRRCHECPLLMELMWKDLWTCLKAAVLQKDVFYATGDSTKKREICICWLFLDDKTCWPLWTCPWARLQWLCCSLLTSAQLVVGGLSHIPGSWLSTSWGMGIIWPQFLHPLAIQPDFIASKGPKAQVLFAVPAYITFALILLAEANHMGKVQGHGERNLDTDPGRRILSFFIL